MEKEVYFAFDTRKTNLYFKNAVTMEGKVLKVFDDTTNKYRTYSVPLPETLLRKGSSCSILRYGQVQRYRRLIRLKTVMIS